MNLPIAPVIALVCGSAAAAAVALLPTPVLETLVLESGVPAVLAAAEPPLGMTARLALAAGAGGLVAVFAWFAAFLLVGTRGLAIGGRSTADGVEAVPTLRRADAHPDAPPRPPLRADRDLGTPFLDVRAPGSPAPLPISERREREPEPVIERTTVAPPPTEQALPVDLDQPLAAFDPEAIPAVPVPPPVPFPAQRRRAPRRPAIFDASERFETFELTPPVRPVPAPTTPMPETDASIEALLDRLERGVVRRGLGGSIGRGDPAHAHGLEDALVSLRNLARGG